MIAACVDSLSRYVRVVFHAPIASVAWVKSRDLHWALLAQKELRDVSLSSLRLLLVADASNPWSLTACDSFLAALRPRGLRPEALCTVAFSSEALTLAVTRYALLYSLLYSNSIVLYSIV